jgi:hypothetical protein
MSRRQDQDKKKLLERLSKTPIVEVACKQAGVPRSTYYRWRKDDGTFRDSCDQALADATELMSDLAESQLLNNIKSGNLTAIIFWLKYHREVYSDRITIKRIESERDHYKQLLDSPRDDGHKALRELAEAVKKASEYKKEAYEAEQHAIMLKAFSKNEPDGTTDEIKN